MILFFVGAIAQYHASFNAIKKSLRLRSIINNYKNDEKKKRRNYPPLINESAPASSRLPIPTTCLVFARVCVFFFLFFFPLSFFLLTLYVYTHSFPSTPPPLPVLSTTITLIRKYREIFTLWKITRKTLRTRPEIIPKDKRDNLISWLRHNYKLIHCN